MNFVGWILFPSKYVDSKLEGIDQVFATELMIVLASNLEYYY